MSQRPAAKITIDQLRNREIVTVDLLESTVQNHAVRQTIITVPGKPLSVFGRKVAGHDD